ncbi:hypothetical protein T07_10747 [Trichinella nelsoni]|uniref:Uncharacterized protein n=1 Tax=Trichinella nelsoni TaxID=6336 RepID=A0A0V0RET6_9BILA|nr:hypothetical protein T07_10747 [Trichinella nelsoni]
MRLLRRSTTGHQLMLPSSADGEGCGVQGEGYAPGYASGNFLKFSKFFRNLAPGVASGYAPGFTPISNRVQYLERVKSNHLPVDIPTVKGMWPYRYVSDLPLHFVYNSHGLRYRMMSVLVPSGVSSLGNKGVHKLFQFGLAYLKVAQGKFKFLKNEIAFFALLDMRLLRRSTTGHQLMLPSSADGEGCGVQGEGYAPGYASGNFLKFSKFFRNLAPGVASGYAPGNLAPGVASGYAPGQIKICIFPLGD